MKISPNMKASLWCIVLIVYFAIAILGFENAKAETTELDKMYTVSMCIAAQSYVMESLAHKPSLAKLFKQEADKYITLWQENWPDIEWGEPASTAWTILTDSIKDGTIEYSNIVDVAEVCSKGMIEAGR